MSFFTADDLIYAYTREDAIRDGFQALIYDDLRKEAGIKFPVYFNQSVLTVIEMAVNNKKHCNDWEGIMWDIFTMFKYYAKGNKHTNSFLFCVAITGAGNTNKRNWWFKAMVGPTDIDNPAPAITIMLPDED